MPVPSKVLPDPRNSSFGDQADMTSEGTPCTGCLPLRVHLQGVEHTCRWVLSGGP